MAAIAFIDFETRSTVDLTKTGVEVYAAHPSTEALCLCWTFDADPHVHSSTDVNDDDAHADIFDHVRSGGRVVAHNARFELHIWRMLSARYGWPELRIEQLYDTMAAARSLSLPGSLGQLAAALRLPVQKDTDGHRLMLKMCKPRKPRKHEPQDAIIWHDAPADVARLVEYCRVDVETERAVYNAIPLLPDAELETWRLDQRINDFGVHLDVETISNCLAAVDVEQSRLAGEIRALTGGQVPSPGAAAKLRAWLAERGVDVPNLKKGTVAAALASPLDGEAVYSSLYADVGGKWGGVDPGYRHVWETKAAEARRGLEIRQEASKASTAKLRAMLRGAGADDRARGLLEYHGAATGRWAGRRVQPQNMPRTPKGFKVRDAENIFGWLTLDGGAEGVRCEYKSVMDAVSWSLRALITPAPGSRFLCADYSNIEGRVLAWLAGETWKLDAFRDYDRILDWRPDGEHVRGGPDLYKLTYSKSSGIAVEDVDDTQRQIGKVQELALGYQGGHGAFLNMAGGYGIDLDQIAAAVRAAVSPGAWAEAEQQYWSGARESAEEVLAAKRLADRLADEENEPADVPVDDDTPELFDLMAELAKSNRFGLSPDVWAAIRLVVDMWRSAHENIVLFWRMLNHAAISAVADPGSVHAAGRFIKYRVHGRLLYCRLPSGRFLAYPYPRIIETPSKWNPDRTDRKIEFEGVDSRTRKWGKQRLYGGLLAENVTQAVARDVLAGAMHRIAAAGYPIAFHVHDEIVSEMPNGRGSLAEFESLMAMRDPWSAELPIAVAGWEGDRYRK